MVGQLTELESVGYSAIYNGSAIIMVLGHENCGAVAAVLAHTTQDIPAIAKLINAGKVDVVGALYDLDTGKVQLLPGQE
jgi:carbonic anhydrase